MIIKYDYRNYIPLTIKVAPFDIILKFWPITLHPISIPSLIGSALIVSTDDHTSTDILLVVTDISLYCLMESFSELPSTVQNSTFAIPSQVKLASV